jgi:signal transduction histidine kinase
VLDQLGLPGAIREAATAQLPARGVEVELLLPERLPALPAVTEVAAYYIALEAIQNIQRHAAARSCRVRLDLDDGTLELEISDDGRGLAGAAPGVGLRSMQERAREAGGGCEITSDARGTRVLARLPLSEA